MTRLRSLSYDAAGTLYLDEWHRNEGGLRYARSEPLGHINNPRTGFKVPESLSARWDELVAEWAERTAARLERERSEGRA